jgi:methylthioribose-1-phosphate isomerase
MSLLAFAFIIMIFVNPTSEAINALAVIAAPIAAMVAAYYGITLSIQQVKNERAEKEKALARAEAAEAISRETEVWSAQMESGLRVAMAKLTAAGVATSEVTKAAGTPADFF